MTENEAAGLIKHGDTIFYSLAGSAPVALVNAVSRKLPELEDITFITGLVAYPFDYLYKPEYMGKFKHHTLFYFNGDRNAPHQMDVNIHTDHFSQSEAVLSNGVKPNVLMMECAPPDENGYLSYGVYGISCNHAVALHASTILVQINRNAPFIHGVNNLIHVSQVHGIVEKDHDLFKIPSISITDVEEKIACHIVDRIEDGSTIQIGVGGLANAVCSFLDNRKDLGIHTEMFVDAMKPLVERGVINGSRKTLHPGEATCSFGGSSKAVYEFMHENPVIRMHPLSYINNPSVIAKNKNFVSVNNAMTVDLTGQVCSESVGFKQYSCTGGQLDFVRGARMAENGKSFIALTSATMKGDKLVNRIVLCLAPGQVVTTPRSDVDMVVTEYGVAELKHKTIRERVLAMVSIAHPLFRDELMTGARIVGLV
jgi:4-hydroxybutyrate CoA-transferase